MKRLTLSLFLSATLSVLPAVALAQDNTTAPASSTTEGNAMAEFTSDTVDPADPFGEIDVTSAGATQEEVTAFFNALTPEQQQELAARCAVITDPVHQERYSEETATVLCNNLIAFNLAPATAQ
jgi:hypothetical protein